MRAVILAGGQGTRLRPYTTVFPKPLIPIGDRPVLELIIRKLADSGFRRIDLCVGHLGHLIKAYFAEGTNLPEPIDLRYHWEEEPLGTAGALRQIGDLDEPFLAMNGDILTSLDYRELMQFHAKRNASLTIAAQQKRVHIDLGVIESEGGLVAQYVEKPTFDFQVSMGVYVYHPSVLAQIPDNRFEFPDLVHRLLEAGEKVSIYPFDGEWFDIGTPEEYEKAVARFESEPRRFSDG
jgi:NDP-mannose synthase